MKLSASCVAVVLMMALLATASLVRAEEKADAEAEPATILKGRPDVPSGELLGPVYESQSAGIAFRPPADAKQIKRGGVPDEVVQYVNEDEDFIFKVSRLTFKDPGLPLTSAKDQFGRAQQGILEHTLEQLKRTVGDAEVLRQDVTNIGDWDVGMLVMRFAIGTKDHLMQQAIVRGNNQLYYVLELISPGAKPRTPLDQENPKERAAVDMFTKILESVRLLDQGKLKEEQDQRLFRTRALYANLTETRLKKVLLPEQWRRIIRNGKDIGYMYIVEEKEKQSDTGGGVVQVIPGVLIGIRSRTYPDQEEPALQVDAESWMFSSFDRKHEDWSSVAIIDPHDPKEKKEKTHVSEFGSSDRQISRVLDENLQVGEKDDPKQPPVRQAEAYSLSVQHMGKSASRQPLTRELPPFYLPQAIGHLLPRLFPLREPKGYLFATYVGDRREVMLRYIDVKPEREATIDGKKVRAVPVEDRLGLEGSVTTHYMDPEGEYLGSINEETKVSILPTDAATLQQLWKEADLTRPGKIEQSAVEEVKEQKAPAKKSRGPK